MGRIFLFFCVLVCSMAFARLDAQNLSNRGREFWLGYGHNNLFDNGNGQQLVLYLSTEQAANVTISVNGTSFSQTYSIPANTVRQTVEIPKTGTNDARIRSEGLSSRGINIISDVPIVAYAHQYGSNSSGATMLMPVETFGYTYYSLNYTQESNSTPSYSWFFIVASENNTRVEITPSVRTQNGQAANVPFVVNLSRGQIYNVFGQSSGLTGFDLSGSKIKSIAGSDGECHPIGVFSGASRMVICGTSGEFMQQQIFPASAWGTRYLTYPTVRTTNIGQSNNNFYRVAVRDPTTIVKRNGTVLTNLINNFYYEFSGNFGEYIEADKPVLVGQYAPSEQTSGGCTYVGSGDPEMIFLSPIEQAINKATFYATSNQSIVNVFVSIIIPTGGVNSLTINGSSAFDLIRAHPQNSAYRVVVKSLTPNAQYTIQSDSAFTAITYGFGTFESYGLNAGTLVNNLDAVPAIQNTLSQTGTNSFTCPRSPFNFSVKLSYKPTQMVWRFSQVNNFLPNQDTTLVNPLPTDSSVVGTRLFYEYRLPREYIFTDTGSYTIPLIITSPNIDNCNNSTVVDFRVRVNPPPKADFTFTYTGCKTDTAFLFGTFTGAGYTASRYRWSFPDNTTDTLRNTKKVFPAEGTNLVKLRVIADNGCVADTTKPVVTSPPPRATFGMTPAGGCEGTTVNFTDTSSYAGGTIQNWFWDFGNGVIVNAPTNAPQTQTYNAAGIYTIKHFAQSGTCRGDTAIKTLQIYAKPVVSFIVPTGCLADSVAQFTNTTTMSDGQSIRYLWNFGDPNATPANPNTDTARNPSHKYSAYGTYNVSLTVTTANGCTSTRVIPFTIGGFSTPINYTVLNESSLCIQNQVQVRNQMNVTTDSIYRIDIYWDVLTQPAVFTQINSPVANAIYSNLYPLFTTPATLSYTIKWVVYSRGGCISEKSKTITLNAAPVVAIAALPVVCINAAPVTLTQGSVTNNLTGNGGYSGIGVTGNTFNPAVAGVGTHVIKYLFTTPSGCVSADSTSIIVYAKPVAKWGYRSQCDSIQFRDSSTSISGSIALWNWNYGDGNTEVRTNGFPFNRRYATAGTYNASLVVMSSQGCSSDTMRMPVIYTPVSLPAFSVANENTLCSKNNVVLTNTTNAGLDTVSRIDVYWDAVNQPTVFETFTNPAANAQFSHLYPTFTSPATKQVIIRMVMFSRGGCATEISKTITLHAVPVLTVTQATRFCVNDAQVTLQIGASNVQGAGQFFGPGTTSAGLFTPSQAGVGSHIIRYTFTSIGGCIDSTTMRIVVSPRPLANFGFSSVCVGDSTAFRDSSNLSAGNITGWSWDFGDGSSSTARPPFNKLYQNSGTFNVQLIVTSDSGCYSAPATKPLRVSAAPLVNFGLPTSVCMPGGVVNFNNLSTLPNGSVTDLSFTWDFGDGATATGFNASHVYADSNLYTIKLTATSFAGCTKDTSRTFSAFFRKPVADFDVSSSAICQGVRTTFRDKSFAPSSTIATYAWRFGDGSVSSDTMPGKTYGVPGNYTVSLQVTTPQGCTADTSRDIKVFLQPKVDAGVSVYIPENSFYQLQPFVNDTSLRFRWTPPFYLDNDTLLRPMFRTVATQTLTLSATGDGNCTGSDTVRITVLKQLRVPNVFSPNGDGVNEIWQIPGLPDYAGNTVEVFNRYGQSVYRTNGYTKPWDGTLNGKPLPVGTYYYIIDLGQPNYKPINGSVMILR